MRTVLQVLGKHVDKEHVQQIVYIAIKQVELLKLHLHDLMDEEDWLTNGSDEALQDVKHWSNIRDRYIDHLKEIE